MRGKEAVAVKYRPLGTAPHKEEEARTELMNEPIVTEARAGDYYEFGRNAGGGGGHKLTVVLSNLTGDGRDRLFNLLKDLNIKPWTL
uniref:Uncharacterized protein n=1 Tax=Amphimedon queenslandica TaxID=400682 RepID=A0A1X7U8C3_AMPQE